jgi:hypothetical protein
MYSAGSVQRDRADFATMLLAIERSVEQVCYY